MSADWIDLARRRLLDLRGNSAGWGYRPGTSPAVEPTALAGLALLATAGAEGSPGAEGPVPGAADWLVSLQGTDGSLGVSVDLRTPGWATAYAVLLWAALGGRAEARRRAVGWMVEMKGESIPARPDSPLGHDTTLVGWPWIARTHSWLEPTALAVLVLGREGLVDHPRTLEGLALIRDRAIGTGGWNYGNNLVFGRSLRPQPAPTGLALLALSRYDAPGPIVERAARYLLEALPSVRSASSLCWGLLGLTAWGRRPVAADSWLSEAFDQDSRRPATAPRLAGHLLAAGGSRSLELLGIPRVGRSDRDG